MNIQTLPTKILTALKKILNHLNKRTHASNSVITKRKFFSVALAAVTLILLSGFISAQVMSAIQTSNTISSMGTLNLSAGIGVYEDSSFSNAMTAINWGTLEPGSAQTHSVYIRNEGGLDLTLSMSTSNWSPSSASNYLTLTWNYDGQPVNASEYVSVSLTLTVSPDAAGITSFSFEVNIVGTG